MKGAHDDVNSEDEDGFDFGELAPTRAKPKSWRDDPAVSHADLSLRITVEEGGSTTYHVHKWLLDAKCTYFQGKFQFDRAASGEREEAQLQLLPHEAEVLPAMLDFMYGVTTELQASTESAVALFRMADMLGAAELHRAITAFMQTDLQKSTAIQYLCDAEALNQQKVCRITRR